jgi:TRAP-type mannitol/chloroaromatic compound transport system permease small subunit
VAQAPSDSTADAPVAPPREGGALGLPETRFSRLVEPWITWVGKAASIFWPILIAVIAVNVVMRYAFGSGRVEFEEIQWHLFAVGFLLPLGWCALVDAHVRIDVVAEHYPRRAKLWVELFGLVFWLLPFVLVVLWYSVPFVAYSFRINEVSEAPGGLPYRYAVKAFLFIGFFFLALSALSQLTRVVAALRGERAGPGA